MIEIREISDDDFLDFSKMRYGTAEYLFLTHVWYYDYDEELCRQARERVRK